VNEEEDSAVRAFYRHQGVEWLEAGPPVGVGMPAASRSGWTMACGRGTMLWSVLHAPGQI
jgi:hypothetical protein